jgi:hypothetical protein
MATCGYLCPKCEGRGFTDDGEICDWCETPQTKSNSPQLTDQEEWIKQVHENPCCGDLGIKTEDKGSK